MAKSPCLILVHFSICGVGPGYAHSSPIVIEKVCWHQWACWAVPVGKSLRTCVSLLHMTPLFLCTMQNETLVFEPLQCQTSRFGQFVWCKQAWAWTSHLKEFATISSRYKTWFILYTPKMMELWLHKEPYHQPFLVFNRYIFSPTTLLMLVQNYSSELLLLSVPIFKTKNFLWTIQEHSMISEWVHEQAPGAAFANMPWFKNSHSMNTSVDKSIL